MKIIKKLNITYFVLAIIPHAVAIYGTAQQTGAGMGLTKLIPIGTLALTLLCFAVYLAVKPRAVKAISIFLSGLATTVPLFLTLSLSVFITTWLAFSSVALSIILIVSAIVLGIFYIVYKV